MIYKERTRESTTNPLQSYPHRLQNRLNFFGAFPMKKWLNFFSPQLFSEGNMEAEFALYLLLGFSAVVAAWWIALNFIEGE